MIKSPLRYPGGKSRAIKFIEKYIPDYSELREPMIGGGSLIFYFVQKFEGRKYRASDLNYDLYCFWHILKTNSAGLIEAVQNVFNNSNDGKDLYNQLLLRRKNTLTEFDRAVDFFILNRITFSGVVDAGGFSRASYNHRFTQSSITRLRQSAEVINKIEITHGDYSLLLKKPGKNVFVFLDPPYYSVSSSRLYGKNGCLHTGFNHEQFFSDVEKCNHKWLITYDNSRFIRDLYKDYYQIEWELQYGMNNYKQNSALKGKELLIANYDLKEQSINNPD